MQSAPQEICLREEVPLPIVKKKTGGTVSDVGFEQCRELGAEINVSAPGIGLEKVFQLCSPDLLANVERSEVLGDMLVDLKPDRFPNAESRSTQQGTEHLSVPFGMGENPRDDFAGEVRRVLFAPVHHRHVDEVVIPFAREELFAFLVDSRSHDRLDDLRVGDFQVPVEPFISNTIHSAGESTNLQRPAPAFMHLIDTIL
jgi:hypothetical protein